MKSSLLRILGLALGCSTAHATLIGDSISFQHFWPSLGEPYNTQQSTVVQAGAGDVVSFIGAPAGFLPGAGYTINPEANTILITTVGSFPQWNGDPFNGLVISGINATVVGVSVSTNYTGWNNANLTFDAHNIYANWAGTTGFTPDKFFNITVSFANSTPDGGATAALLGLAVLGLATLRRRVA